MNNIFDNQKNEGLYGGRKASEMWLERVDEILTSNDVKRNKALDIGCGGGIYTFALKDLGFEWVTGVDNSETMLNSAITENREESIEFKGGDFFNNKLAADTYDFALSRAVIHHIKNLTEAFAETYRVLKKNGMILIQDRTREDIDLPSSDSNLRGYLYDFKPSLKEFDKNRRHSEKEVLESLGKAGFQNIGLLKINELRKSYKNIEELKVDYLSRKGKSILFNLDDKELREFVEFLINQINKESDIEEADQWTLWVAKK